MFKLPMTNAFSKYVLCIYSAFLKRLSPQQLRCAYLVLLFLLKLKTYQCFVKCHFLPSPLSSHAQEELEILYQPIPQKTFQTARKLSKWEKEINGEPQGNKSASHDILKTLSPRIWPCEGEAPKPGTTESVLCVNPNTKWREHCPDFKLKDWVQEGAASTKARPGNAAFQINMTQVGRAKEKLKISYGIGMVHSLQTLNTQNSSMSQPSLSMRCQEHHLGSLSAFEFTELLRATVTSLSPQPQVPEFIHLRTYPKQKLSCHKSTKVPGCQGKHEAPRDS